MGSRIENLGRWVAQANGDINAAYGGSSVFVNAGWLEIGGRDVTFSMGFTNPGGTLAVTDGGSLRFFRNIAP